MDINQFRKELKAKERKIDSMLRRRAPKIIGRLAENHYRANFRKGGFVDEQLEPWAITKRQRLGGQSADSKYGPLLSSRKQLMKATAHEASDYRAHIFNNTEYAAIHNEGGVVYPAVTPKMRRYAWYRFFELGNRAKSPRKQKRIRTLFRKFDFATVGINNEVQMYLVRIYTSYHKRLYAGGLMPLPAYTVGVFLLGLVIAGRHAAVLTG